MGLGTIMVTMVTMDTTVTTGTGAMAMVPGGSTRVLLTVV
jgi:hypothetical protein